MSAERYPSWWPRRASRRPPLSDEERRVHGRAWVEHLRAVLAETTTGGDEKGDTT